MTERKHPRLKEYDYRNPGAYFVTICCEKREPWLAEIDPSGYRLSDYGEIVQSEILQLPKRYPYVEIPKYVVMPNHLHLILVMKGNVQLNDQRSVPEIIGAFKSLSTRACRQAGFSNPHLYQTSFYEHVIRGDLEFEEIWNYIDGNPLKWLDDWYFIP